ncbi:MAG TPA: type II toxin-antitoxin system VapC family toxin [Caulobacteraceae bacterium]|nr:type II toxin-antitoxin system VapC family toxin [Caulobacteraceae bacterium]
MRLLLDTHILLWALIEPARLGADARSVIEDPDNEVLFSAASLWEMSIKAALGRADFRVSPPVIFAEAVKAGFVELPVRSAAAMRVATLPLLHRDPFDRLLVAQAMVEPARLYTADAELAAYSELVVRV